jgi:hypothetical protein
MWSMQTKKEEPRTPVKGLEGLPAERYCNKKDQFAYFLDVITGGATTGDAAVDYVIKDGFAKGGKRPDLSAMQSNVEGVRSLRKELELHRDEQVLAVQKSDAFEIFRWGYVVKTGDVFVLERNDSTLKTVPYGREMLAINTGDSHWGYDKTIYNRIYELRMNLPFQRHFKHVFGKDAEKTIKEITEKYVDA